MLPRPKFWHHPVVKPTDSYPHLPGLNMTITQPFEPVVKHTLTITPLLSTSLLTHFFLFSAFHHLHGSHPSPPSKGTQCICHSTYRRHTCLYLHSRNWVIGVCWWLFLYLGSFYPAWTRRKEEDADTLAISPYIVTAEPCFFLYTDAALI